MGSLDIRPYLAEEERQVISSYSTGFNRKVSIGRRPAVVAIDFTTSFVGLDAPISESIKKWPKSSGAKAWKALRKASRIISTARSASYPIYYTIPLPVISKSGVGSKTSREKSVEDLSAVVPEIAPREGDRLIYKHYPSGFFGTNMVSRLIQDEVDTLIFTGGTTSGCVRATVVDGASYHFRNIIVSDAIFDRIQISNIVNIFDMRMKYADVTTTEKILHMISALSRNSKRRLARSF